jgi:phage shock protein PspC (stress-responsive transcriptional regulator)
MCAGARVGTVDLSTKATPTGAAHDDSVRTRTIMMDNIHRTLAQNGLVRARQDNLLGGVASGLGRRIGVEPWPARLLFVLVLLLLPGSQLLVYPILWILMPSEAKATTLLRASATSGPAPAAPAV